MKEKNEETKETVEKVVKLTDSTKDDEYSKWLRHSVRYATLASVTLSFDFGVQLCSVGSKAIERSSICHLREYKSEVKGGGLKAVTAPSRTG